VQREIVTPVVDAMRAEGHAFRGFLYAGLMLTDEGPKVIEFNVRLGDPEAQVVLPRLDGDLAPLLLAASTDGLPRGAEVGMRPDPHVGVVLASGGYPGHIDTGKRIDGLERAASEEDVLVFHAATRRDGDRFVTSGGRVLTIVGRGAEMRQAIDRAYAGVALVSFDAMHVRRDIGRKALG
jgi:phosphoribosylamine--glycine ligase